MKRLLIMLLLVCPVFAGLNEMEQRQEGTAKGFILRQQLKPPEELFKDVQPEVEDTVVFEEFYDSYEEPTHEPVPEPENNSGYVKYEKYMDDMMEANAKVMMLEVKLERLIKLTENIQESTISNKSFILKLVEILFGSGGVLATIILLWVKFKSKKKEGV